MTTLKGKSKTYYNYLVKHEGKIERFKMTSEIKDKYGIPTNTIFHIINKKNKRKWLDFEIENIKEPVFEKKLIDYSSSSSSDIDSD
tara:strand:- start:1220 stop:1477 length:258 start_codon:yes stop_codon:yes gene_type:complete